MGREGGMKDPQMTDTAFAAGCRRKKGQQDDMEKLRGFARAVIAAVPMERFVHQNN